MSLPSFVFSGLDKETLGLSSELAALGGGNAVVKSMELHVVNLILYSLSLSFICFPAYLFTRLLDSSFLLALIIFLSQVIHSPFPWKFNTNPRSAYGVPRGNISAKSKKTSEKQVIFPYETSLGIRDIMLDADAAIVGNNHALFIYRFIHSLTHL